MRKYFQIVLYLLAAAFFSSAHAGAYEDWWRGIKQDHPAPIVDLLKRGYDPNALDPQGVSGLYLAPVPYRGKTNNPSYVPFVARQIAELRKLPVEAIAEATSRNFETLFKGVKS